MCVLLVRKCGEFLFLGPGEPLISLFDFKVWNLAEMKEHEIGFWVFFVFSFSMILEQPNEGFRVRIGL